MLEVCYAIAFLCLSAPRSVAAFLRAHFANTIRYACLICVLLQGCREEEAQRDSSCDVEIAKMGRCWTMREMK